MSLLATVAICLAVVTAAALCVWIASVTLRDVSIVDVFWGFGFVLVAWTVFLIDAKYDSRDLLLATLTTIWGLRLAVHLLLRKWGEEEDRRYRAMRERAGRRFWWTSLFTVFLLQAALLWFVALPLQIAVAHERPADLSWIDGVGFAVWTLGFFFESVGDLQLVRFKARPENGGRVMDRGLWRYTRHPNYFGDFCVWWGLYLIAAAGGAWWTILSPLAMSFLLLRVSGLTLLEGDMAERRPDYREYQARTNAFFPGPPRSVPPRSKSD